MSSVNEAEREHNPQAIVVAAAKLVEQVERAYGQGEAVHEVQRGLFHQLLRLGHQLLELFFGWCGTGDRGTQVKLDDGRSVKRLEDSRVREYRSVFGVHEVERVVYGTREGQRIEYVPVDAQLQWPAGQFSYRLHEWDQAVVVEQPSAQVSAMLERIWGFAQSVHSLERMNQQVAASVQAFWAARKAAPAAQGEGLIVCSADSKGGVMRPALTETASRAEANAPTEASEDELGGKKMALLGAVYTIAPDVRTPEQVLQALFERPSLTGAQPPARPKPLHQYVRASLARDAHGKMAPS
jgi:hypothetical protein